MPQVGMTPLHEASGRGHGAVVGALLEAGANIEAKNSVRGEGGGLKDGKSCRFTGAGYLCYTAS